MTGFSLLVRLRFLTTLVLLLLVTGASADFQGRVVAIADGDTFTLLTPGNQQVKIRLAEIDAPESGQPYGQKSKQALSDLVFGKNVVVRVQTTDRYGRTVGRPSSVSPFTSTIRKRRPA